MNSLQSFRFMCKMMGTCCIHNQVILNPLDIYNIARALDVPSKYLFNQKIITYIINQKDMWMEPIIHLKNEICPFLVYKSDTKKACDIHEHRPTVCRIFPLNLNTQNSSFSIPENASDRCKECFDTERNIQIEEYLEESNLNDKLIFYRNYVDFKNELILSGFTLNGIKGNPTKRKKFFRIQEILYEKYPSSSQDTPDFPWDDIQIEIKDLVDID